MKHTVIIEEKTQNLILGYSSETTWIPLSVGDFIEADSGILFVVLSKTFCVRDDTLTIYVGRKDEE